MKCLLFLLLLTTFSIAQKPDKSEIEILNCEPILGDFLWMANTEVSNKQYLEFLDYQKNNGSAASYKLALPDTTVWNTKFRVNKKYVDYYFRHPAYKTYPVVGVSKEQATAYCNWLTTILNQNFKSNPKSSVLKVKVRLPLEQEWKMAARAGNEHAVFGWKGDGTRSDLKKYKGSIKGNYVRSLGDYMGASGSLYNAADVTAPVQSYWPNDYALYNMSGNVSEFLLDSDYAIGGSWKSRIQSLAIDARNDLRVKAKQSDEIGFRYLVEVVSFKESKKVTKALKAKDIEELLVDVNGEFKISKFEVSNKLYNYFICENQIEEYKSVGDNWNGVGLYYERYANDYSNRSKYENYPVVNISYQSAIVFCKWLTKKYTSFEKRSFKKITFQLPTEEQWEIAAKGGIKDASYPWGGPYIRNSKGEYLANFLTVRDLWIDIDMNTIVLGIEKLDYLKDRGRDGYYDLTPINSYYSNMLGIYNMAGNANEMVLEKKCKGGSWLSLESCLQIESEEMYKGVSAKTGFRFIAVVK